jgi:hypothetical protein
MSDTANWQENNNRYLSDALAWLRLRLERHAVRPASTEIILSSVSEPNPALVNKRRFLRRRTPQPEPIIPVLLPAATATGNISDDQIAQAAERMQASEAIDPPPALVMLSQLLSLSRFEREVLLLCAALEFDTRIATLCARAQDDATKPYPTFALALALFDEPDWAALSPERPLRYWRLLEINQPGGQALTISPLRLDERIVSYLKGLNYPDDRLGTLLTPLAPQASQPDLPPSHQQAVEAIIRHWKQSPANALLPLIQLVGPDSASKQLVAAQASAQLGRQLYRLPVEALPTRPADLETLARLWQRESLLLPLALYLEAEEADGHSSEGPGELSPLSRFLNRSDGVFFLSTREVWARLERPNLALDIDRPTQAEQQTIWNTLIGEKAPDSPPKLSAQFNLSLPAIQQIAEAASEEAGDNEDVLPNILWDSCRRSLRPRMDTLAQRLEPKVSWDDLVLPDEEKDMLHQIANQVGQRSRVYEEWGFGQKLNRGKGISVLFAGDSGTGKTMAAEVIANHLRLNLYRIDLSAVVSKYIGETEKNLRRLFDAAEEGGAILFFDEADALFGKRSEVKDSHDRYANIEVNYLLQRMEAYSGLAILATNMKSALDLAFMRRLRFIVNFPFPGQAERRKMWEKIFPKQMWKQVLPEGEPIPLDYDRLARLNLTGGSILNVALNAAFVAAELQKPVTMEMVLAADRAEFRKLDRPINEADFRWVAPQPQGARA